MIDHLYHAAEADFVFGTNIQELPHWKMSGTALLSMFVCFDNSIFSNFETFMLTYLHVDVYLIHLF